jgi:uncharacterized phage protein (TIGR01671 family)
MIMREILFRGKEARTGKWIEGYYCPCVISGFPASPCIIGKENLDKGVWTPDRIIPKSIGQFTGLTDKNGKKVFEGDIIRIFSSDWWCGYTDNRLEKEKCIVSYKENTACFEFYDGKFKLSFDEYLYHDSEKKYSLEVIGNVHDNPELLEVKE